MSLGLLGWRVLGPDAGSVETRPLSTPDNSDYYMRDATIHQMSETGALAYRMDLGETLHYPDTSARLRDIDVHYLAGTSTYWDLDAARGRVPAGSRDIYLYDGVTLRHPKPDGDIVVIETNNAWVRPQADRIETQAHVTATSPGQVVEGDGMTVNLETDQLRLLENVQVEYVR